MPPRRRTTSRGLTMATGLEFAFRPSVELVAARVDKLGMDIRSFREPLKRSIQQVMAPSFRKNFDVGGRPAAWEPLAAGTVDIRGSSRPILNRKGKLRSTVQQFNIWSVDREQATLRDLPEAVWYGKVHQAGTGSSGRSRSSDIPQREFVLIQDPEDFDAIERVFERWLQERALKAGLNITGGF